MLVNILTAASLISIARAHGGDHEGQMPIAGPHKSLWYNTLPGDGGTQGAPFDTGTSYRPGARFGPSGIRQGSRRLNLYGGYNVPLATNPFDSWATVIDCGDIPVTSYDNSWALHQIEEGHSSILSRSPATNSKKLGPAKNGKTLPRVITLGGDHTITLPLLRSINRAYGPISVIHFDFAPRYLETKGVWWKSIKNRFHQPWTTLSGPSDYENDGYCGFEIVEAREIDTIGMGGIIEKIRNRVGLENPVLFIYRYRYFGSSIRSGNRGLEGVNLIAADIVEVAPAYDTNAEHTTMAAADALYEVLSLMVKKGPLSLMMDGKGAGKGE
ncbi:hypothetical protein EYC84_001109 [Monilinia fructicola]|uniref:Agmatinase n=1 Tax=Monilinia fructicola TaxID=38448 RepID=A0A5M9JNB3_MONFR|nr:hypothetical protein EYC84_001109 [Monilinia fructicola]